MSAHTPATTTVIDILKAADDFANVGIRRTSVKAPAPPGELIRADVDARSPRAMLAAQTGDLDRLFIGLVSRAAQVHEPHMADLLLRLALKAQAQCASTLRVLGELKDP